MKSGVAACKQPIALPPYSHISVSSEKKFKRGSSCMAEDGFIMTNKAWCAKSNNGKSSHTGWVDVYHEKHSIEDRK